MTASISSSSPSSAPARVDVAHVRSNELVEPLEEPSSGLLAAIAGRRDPENLEQLRRQALDLSATLLAQQADLDQREAEVNARLAQLDSRTRAMRLHDQDHRRQPTASPEGRLSSRPDADVTAMLQETTRRWREAIYGLSNIKTSESQAARPRIQDTRTANTKKELDERRITLERLQDEMTQLHREAIEMRLATEQLWARMSESTDPAELTKSLAELRNRLADHFQMENDLIAERKRELESLRIEASGKVDELRSQRERLQKWVNRQHEEIEHQAARLIAREQELDRVAEEQRYSKPTLARRASEGH